MKSEIFTVPAVAMVLLILGSFSALGETGENLAVDSLLGKFEGSIQVDNGDPVKHSYQTEVIAVDDQANTVTLTASCMDCGTKRWVRNKCEIGEVKQRISFTCKGPKSEERYIFDGKAMTATGFGNRYPYSIEVTKLGGGI